MPDEEDDFLRQEHEREPEEHVLLAHLGQRARQNATDVVMDSQRLHICNEARPVGGGEGGLG